MNNSNNKEEPLVIILDKPDNKPVNKKLTRSYRRFSANMKTIWALIGMILILTLLLRFTSLPDILGNTDFTGFFC